MTKHASLSALLIVTLLGLSNGYHYPIYNSLGEINPYSPLQNSHLNLRSSLANLFAFNRPTLANPFSQPQLNNPLTQSNNGLTPGGGLLPLGVHNPYVQNGLKGLRAGNPFASVLGLQSSSGNAKPLAASSANQLPASNAANQPASSSLSEVSLADNVDLKSSSLNQFLPETLEQAASSSNIAFAAQSENNEDLDIDSADPLVEFFNRKHSQVADDQLTSVDQLSLQHNNNYGQVFPTAISPTTTNTVQYIPLRTAVVQAVSRILNPIKTLVASALSSLASWFTPITSSQVSSRDGLQDKKTANAITGRMANKINGLAKSPKEKDYEEPTSHEDLQVEESKTLITKDAKETKNEENSHMESKIFLNGLFSTTKPESNEILPIWRILFGPNRNLSDSTVVYSWMYLGALVLYMTISVIVGTSHIYHVYNDDSTANKENEQMMSMQMAMTPSLPHMQMAENELRNTGSKKQEFDDHGGHFLMQVRADDLKDSGVEGHQSSQSAVSAQPYPIYYMNVRNQERDI